MSEVPVQALDHPWMKHYKERKLSEGDMGSLSQLSFIPKIGGNFVIFLQKWPWYKR